MTATEPVIAAKARSFSLVSALKGAVAGLAFGLFLAAGASWWTWLEMRVNVGLLMPAATLGGLLLGAIRRRALPYPIFLLEQVMLALLVPVLYGGESASLTFVPAGIFREGLYLTFLDLKTINIMLTILFIGGNLLWVCHRLWNRSSSR